MHRTNLRKVGGSVMLAVPPALLDVLQLKAGETVGVSVDGGCLIVEPKPKPRYRLEDLLAEHQAAGDLMKHTELDEWLQAKPTGKEII